MEDRNQDLGKTIDEQNQFINTIKLENETLRNQLRMIDAQYRESFAEGERLKAEVLRLKGHLMEVESDRKTSQLAHERLTMELRQAREALRWTEATLEVSK